MSSQETSMKKILIVINDAILLSVFKSWVFRSHKKDTLFFAKDSKEAIEVIKNNPIDLLVTELNLPEIDGLELAAGVSLYHPEVKTVFFLSIQITAINGNLKKLTSLNFISRPSSLKEFIQFVTVIEAADFQAALMAEFVICDFLALIEIHKKTCLLSIETKDKQKKGLIYFEQGVLYDAICGELKAELAVLEILSWTHGIMSFKSRDQRQFRKQVHVSLDVLIRDKDSFIAKANESIDLLVEQADARIKAEEKAVAAAKAEETKAIAVEAKTKADAKAKAEKEAKAESEAKAKVELETLRIKMKALPLEDVILKPLSEIEDYMAFTIFNIAGEVIAEHHICEHNIETIGVHAAVMINSALETVDKIGLGTLNYIQVNSEQGIFIATWIIENQLVAAVLLTPDTKSLGLAKFNLTKACELIRHQLH